MKKLIFILIICVHHLTCIHATTYYVATNGSNANSGLSPSSPWKTLTFAAGNSSPVIAGDTVFVKSGNYGNENVVFQKSGITGNPIVFQGYKNTPGDIPPVLVNNSNPYAVFLTADMPTFDGANRGAGIGFDCTNQKYLTLNNFQIRNYAYGFIAGGANQTSGNLVLNNINVMFVGDVNSSYQGEGILFGSMSTKFSNGNTIKNCLVVNAAAEGFGINGNNNTLTGCKVYCNENTANAPTDYYVIVTGDYNTFNNCYIERLPGISHSGHGYTCKTNAEQVVDQQLSYPAIASQHNKFYYCVARNMGESFCVRHRTAQFNLFYHCKAYGTHTGANNSPSGEGNCVVTRDGASDNIFDGCVADSCSSGFVFEDTVEDGDTGPNPPGHPGNNNKYINCVIYNCYAGVEFSNYSVASDAGDNTIANCTFYKTRYLHYAARACANMKYIGNIYYGCLPNTPGGYFKGSTYSSNIIPNGTNTYFKYCDFINIEGGMPANFVSNSAGSISSNPLFNNAATLDFHLTSSSPCLNAYTTPTFVVTDFDSIPRPQGSGYDMGAYEYSSCGVLAGGTISLASATICSNQSVTFNNTGASIGSGILSAWQVSGSATGPFANVTVGTGSNTATYNTGTLTAGTYYFIEKTTCSSTSLSVNSNTISLLVKPNPTLSVTGNSVICSGKSTTLTAGGANTYTWSNSATQATINVSPTAVTVYTVAGTSAVTGCSASAQYSVSVNPNPTVNITASSATVCSGNSVTLTASGASNYTWTPGNFVGLSYSVNPTANTTYTVTGINANNCSATKTQSIYVAAVPTISVLTTQTLICIGQAATLTASGANTFSWSTGATASVIAVSPSVNTIYTVTGYSATCFSSVSMTQSVSLCTDVNERINFNKEMIFPNPTTGMLNIVTDGWINFCAIYNLLGQQIYQEKTDAAKVQIDLSGYLNGVYILRIKNSKMDKTFKVIKE